VAEDEATAEASRKALRAALPATIRLTDQIRVKEPPPAPAVVAPPAPGGPPVKEAEPTVPPGKADAIAAQTPHMTGSIPPPVASAAAEAQAKACEQQLRELAGAGKIQFHIASAELETASFETLDKLAQAAKACPGTRIEVGGHASSEGNAELNQQLSLRRAQSVVAYLVQAGVETTQLEPVGYGSSRPIAPNDSDENLAKNRRIEFAVRPK
jgi:outer membrane protein OmpA-like peptidoglycan-associated protein